MNTNAMWDMLINRVPGLRRAVERRVAVALGDALASGGSFFAVGDYLVGTPRVIDDLGSLPAPAQRPPDVPRAAAAELDDDQVRREKRAQRLADAMQNDSAAKYLGGGR